MSAPDHPESLSANTLTVDRNLPDPDGFYDELLEAHEGLDATETHALNARLVLILCNHIGDRDVIRAALAAARRSPSGHGGRTD